MKIHLPSFRPINERWMNKKSILYAKSPIVLSFFLFFCKRLFIEFECKLHCKEQKYIGSSVFLIKKSPRNFLKTTNLRVKLRLGECINDFFFFLNWIHLESPSFFPSNKRKMNKCYYQGAELCTEGFRLYIPFNFKM